MYLNCLQQFILLYANINLCVLLIIKLIICPEPLYSAYSIIKLTFVFYLFLRTFVLYNSTLLINLCNLLNKHLYSKILLKVFCWAQLSCLSLPNINICIYIIIIVFHSIWNLYFVSKPYNFAYKLVCSFYNLLLCHYA